MLAASFVLEALTLVVTLLILSQVLYVQRRRTRKLGKGRGHD